MEVYTLYRYMERMKECSYKGMHYFSTGNMVFMLKLCTDNGSIDEFKELNKELLGGDAYGKEVNQRYTNYLNFRYDKVRDGEPDSQSFVSSAKLSDSAMGNLKTLMIREIQSSS
jgi:hypothetical protein